MVPSSTIHDPPSTIQRSGYLRCAMQYGRLKASTVGVVLLLHGRRIPSPPPPRMESSSAVPGTALFLSAFGDCCAATTPAPGRGADAGRRGRPGGGAGTAAA